VDYITLNQVPAMTSKTNSFILCISLADISATFSLHLTNFNSLAILGFQIFQTSGNSEVNHSYNNDDNKFKQQKSQQTTEKLSHSI